MWLHLLLLAIIFNQMLDVLLRLEIKKVVIDRLVLLVVFIFGLLSTFGRVHLHLALVLHEQMLLLLLFVLVA